MNPNPGDRNETEITPFAQCLRCGKVLLDEIGTVAEGERYTTELFDLCDCEEPFIVVGW